MEHYGFQGADIDWEYPSALKRGGRESDKDNLVFLMKELRAAFGTKYGLSMVLAPDYSYLSGSDPKAMEPYVDWFGFMSYDLHGVWDEQVPALGKNISHTANITRSLTRCQARRSDRKLTSRRSTLILHPFGSLESIRPK